MLTEKWEKVPEKARKIPTKFLDICWWIMNSKKWFGAQEKGTNEKIKIKRAGIWLKNRDMPEKDKRLTKRVFKSFLTHHTKSCNKKTSHQAKPIKLIWKRLKAHIFL